MVTPSTERVDNSPDMVIPLAADLVRRNLMVTGISLAGIVLSLAMILLFRPLVGVWLVVIFICSVLVPTEIVFWLRHRKHQLFLTADGMRLARHDETIELSWAEVDAVYFEVRSNTLMLHRPAGDVYLPLKQVAEHEKLRAYIQSRVSPRAIREEAQVAAWPLISQFRQLVSLPTYTRSTSVRPGIGVAANLMLLIILLILALAAWQSAAWVWLGAAAIGSGVLVYSLYAQPRQIIFNQAGVQLLFRRHQASLAWAEIESVVAQNDSLLLCGRKCNLYIPNERRWRGETTAQDMQIYLAAQLWTRQIPVRERWFWPAWSSRALFSRRIQA